MAQTIAEIEDQIDEQILTTDALAELDSTSNIALYKVYRAGIAFILNLFQRQQDDYNTAIQTVVEQKQFGTDPWWQETMLNYQHGDLLQFINNVFQYAVIDPTKQVINLCSVSGTGGLAILKCATLVGGVPQPLTDDQIAGALSYAKEQRPCGIDPVVQSFPADLLKMYLNIYYNAQGDLPTIKALVEAAINNYLSNLDFNGTLYINRLIDAIQTIPAVINDQVFVTEVAAKPFTEAYRDIVSSYQAEAGYFIIDPDFPLSVTLTYIAA